MSELKGKDLAEVIAAGKEKLASVPAGGGGIVVAAAPGGGGGGAAPAAAEAKKEEKVEEKEESDDVSFCYLIPWCFISLYVCFNCAFLWARSGSKLVVGSKSHIVYLVNPNQELIID